MISLFSIFFLVTHHISSNARKFQHKTQKKRGTLKIQLQLKNGKPNSYAEIFTVKFSEVFAAVHFSEKESADFHMKTTEFFLQEFQLFVLQFISSTSQSARDSNVSSIRKFSVDWMCNKAENNELSLSVYVETLILSIATTFEKTSTHTERRYAFD